MCLAKNDQDVSLGISNLSSASLVSKTLTLSNECLTPLSSTTVLTVVLVDATLKRFTLKFSLPGEANAVRITTF